ncbi:Protein DOG1-like 1, partial [Cucurbita argyrosperma subsp. argyrosperma]|uniref:Protein DOG1-like 1 n=1 Tax=Cucurbita moschata TaxID=3662 RepID=A0A6J1EGT4_CUCMO
MAMDTSSGTTHQERSRCCFQEWMQLQRQDLTLLQSLHKKPTHNDHEEIKTLICSCIAHFEDYISTRSRLAQEDPSTFFAPTWCTSLENSLLWIAGCRPTIFVRLVYALSGCEVEARLRKWMEGMRNSNDDNSNNFNSISSGSDSVGELSPTQMKRVDELHMRTLRAEEKLTSEMASLQEELADQPIAVIANEMEGIGVMNEEAEMALKEHETAMRGIMEKADELRLNTLKELALEILKPPQALQFLAASKKLHLCLHQWGKWRDEKHGRRSYCD